MSFLSNLLDKTGLSLVFKRRVDDETLAQQHLETIEAALQDIMQNIESDIEIEKQGLFKHPENPIEGSLGYLQYIISKPCGEKLVLPRFSLVSRNSIKMSESYQQLKNKLNQAGYIVELKEVNIDYHGNDTFAQPADIFDDFERYFVVQISGW